MIDMIGIYGRFIPGFIAFHAPVVFDSPGSRALYSTEFKRDIRGNLSRRQAPLTLQPAFDGLENQTIHDVSNCDNQHHDCNHLTHVVEVATHHQQLPETQTNEDHFAGNQRAPGKRPALLETGENERQAGWKQYVPEQLESFRAEIASCHAVYL